MNAIFGYLTGLNLEIPNSPIPANSKFRSQDFYSDKRKFHPPVVPIFSAASEGETPEFVKFRMLCVNPVELFCEVAIREGVQIGRQLVNPKQLVHLIHDVLRRLEEKFHLRPPPFKIKARDFAQDIVPEFNHQFFTGINGSLCRIPNKVGQIPLEVEIQTFVFRRWPDDINVGIIRTAAVQIDVVAAREVFSNGKRRNQRAHSGCPLPTFCFPF